MFLLRVVLVLQSEKWPKPSLLAVYRGWKINRLHGDYQKKSHETSIPFFAIRMVAMKVLSHKKGLAKYHIVNQSGFSMEYQPRVCCPCRCLWPQKPRYGKARDLRVGRGTDKSVGFDGSNFGVSRCELAAGHDEWCFEAEFFYDWRTWRSWHFDRSGWRLPRPRLFEVVCVFGFWAAFSDLGCFGVMKLAAKVPCPLPS